MNWWVVIASGPSLARADCDTLSHFSIANEGKIIAVNNAVFYTPAADFLYAGDAAWWEVYGDDVDWFKGKRVTHEKYKNTLRFNGAERFRRFGGNSGHQAFQYAIHSGAKKVALLGFDHQHTGGKAHFHKDHQRRTEIEGKVVMLGNASCSDHWIRIMNCSATDAQSMGVEVVNLSRETALTCFPRMSIEEFISQ